ncbi:MAG: Holliday junction branch migration protein RuvA [Microbacterium sp.]|uniref:Holliday junction branch migration protein RuvA n=1 Tax=Microbacterium sp. TaxID=51671 RepID=UPI003A88717F
MISSLRGTVLHIDTDTMIVEVGGVGFSVAVPPDIVREAHVGSELHLHTHLVVREDALALFGFTTRDELVVFLQLLGVPGVGPKSALGVLAGMPVDAIAAAVADEDDAPFRRVSGIGPKTAKLIVVHLAGKLAVVPVTPAPAASDSAPVLSQVTAALVGLGWNERTAIDVLDGVVSGASEADKGSVSALLRLALAQLGPARPTEPAHG